MSEQEMSNIETFGEFCKNNSCSNCRLKKIATITGCFDCEKHFMKEHDKQIRAELLDKVAKKIKDCSYDIYSDISPYPETVVDMEDIDLIICGLKAEVDE